MKIGLRDHEQHTFVRFVHAGAGRYELERFAQVADRVHRAAQVSDSRTLKAATLRLLDRTAANPSLVRGRVATVVERGSALFLGVLLQTNRTLEGIVAKQVLAVELVHRT